MPRKLNSILLSVALGASVSAQADTVCSKSMLRNSYGFSGSAAGFTTLVPPGVPITCAFGGVMVFSATDTVTIRKLSEVCASSQSVLTATIFNQATDPDPTVASYTLDAATCTAKIQFTSSNTGAFLQVMFTNNGQDMHFTLERTGNSYGVAGNGTGSRI